MNEERKIKGISNLIESENFILLTIKENGNNTFYIEVDSLVDRKYLNGIIDYLTQITIQMSDHLLGLDKEDESEKIQNETQIGKKRNPKKTKTEKKL